MTHSVGFRRILTIVATVAVGVALVGVSGTSASAAVKPRVSLSASSVDIGDSVTIRITKVKGVRHCSLTLIGTATKPLGRVSIFAGSGSSFLSTYSLSAGRYQVRATCGRLTATSRVLTVIEPGPSPSDIAEIKTYASRVVRDITELNIRVQDGIVVSTRMSMLAGHYYDLRDAAVPPGVDAANYKARCQTLGDFADMAADDYDYGDESMGYARYQVIKQETVPLFDLINGSLGTSFRVPN